MAQENQSAEIENHCYPKHRNKRPFHRLVEKQLVLFLNFCTIREEIIDYEAVGEVVHKGEHENGNNQSEEDFVVLSTDTIIKIPTVVVKLIYAAITSSAVLGCVFDKSLANIAVKFIIFVVKSDVFCLCYPV